MLTIHPFTVINETLVVVCHPDAKHPRSLTERKFTKHDNVVEKIHSSAVFDKPKQNLDDHSC